MGKRWFCLGDGVDFSLAFLLRGKHGQSSHIEGIWGIL